MTDRNGDTTRALSGEGGQLRHRHTVARFDARIVAVSEATLEWFRMDWSAASKVRRTAQAIVPGVQRVRHRPRMQSMK